MKRGMILSLAVLCGTLTISQGCSRLWEEGFEGSLGPTPKIMFQDPMPPVTKDDKFLREFKNFELAPIETAFNNPPPGYAQFLDYMPSRFTDQIIGKDLPMDPKGPTCLVKIKIIAYQPKVAYGDVTDPTEEVVAKVDLVNKKTGVVKGSAICIGRTYQSIGAKPSWKAWGLCRAIVNNWINVYYPAEGRVEKDDKKEAKPAD